MSLLKDKIAIVTGGGRGIGLAIVKSYLEQGATVEFWGVNEENGLKIASELSNSYSDKVTFRKVDVSVKSDVDNAIQQFLDNHKKIDILVNNAGITRDGLLMRLNEKDWDDVIRTNLNSIYYTSSSVIRSMMKARSGSIINVTSIVGVVGNPGQTNYAAAKAGVIGFSKSLAKEVASRNIRVNCIAPGFIETDMTSVLNDNIKQEIMKEVPMGRIGSADEVAGVAMFLASDHSSYITSQVITVDGGMISC